MTQAFSQFYQSFLCLSINDYRRKESPLHGWLRSEASDFTSPRLPHVMRYNERELGKRDYSQL